MNDAKPIASVKIPSCNTKHIGSAIEQRTNKQAFNRSQNPLAQHRNHLALASGNPPARQFPEQPLGEHIPTKAVENSHIFRTGQVRFNASVTRPDDTPVAAVASVWP